MGAHYQVRKFGKVWLVERLDQIAHIGKLASRKEALGVARMLAGWRGKVTIAR